MSRQLRGERDHVSRDYQEGYLGDFRDLRDLRDFRDYHRDPLGDIRDDRDGQGLREGPVTGRTYRDDYPEEYDHRPTVASTSANLTNNPGGTYSRYRVCCIFSFVAAFIVRSFPLFASRESDSLMRGTRTRRARDDGDDKVENGICPLGRRFFSE
ncbi:uncharacterized protein LOC126855087 isoform X1 [Cataglyphis hispanica]|uniref:uncharacterized protein LOC126855087 isoform X1 n=1 Tax=Cataglyphis hispanica TaxID=1086592 RepID=UPI00217FDB2E|nr:uncharacterized protein LOC126855087 isoform X1 [Cataglyphis hispanica]